MSDQPLDIAGLEKLAAEIFAPMIQALEIKPDRITAAGATFIVPDNPFIVRIGGMVCGQALASIADSVGVLTLFGHNTSSREMTTVDMTTHFMRPLFQGELDVEATILSNGRRMATVRVDIRQRGKEKIAAATTCAYAYV